jgi:hypothetical protein
MFEGLWVTDTCRETYSANGTRSDTYPKARQGSRRKFRKIRWQRLFLGHLVLQGHSGLGSAASSSAPEHVRECMPGRNRVGETCIYPGHTVHLSRIDSPICPVAPVEPEESRKSSLGVH